MLQERIIQLLSRKMAGEATIQELDELDKIVMQYPEWKFFVEQLTAEGAQTLTEDTTEAEATYAAHATNMQLTGRFNDTTTATADEAVISIHQSRSSWKKWVTGIAAMLLLTAGALYFFNTRSTATPQTATNEVVTKKGSTSRIKLPDGTQVWLNTDSKLTYAGDFSGPSREVTLSGEAYFDVAKDSSHPFIIHTDKINIRVLGTAFNVKNYAADEVVETALIHGRIEVTFTDRPLEKIILKPNEKLVVRKDQGATKVVSGQSAAPKVTLNNISLAHDSLVVETAWMSNTIAFTDQSLLDIARMLERKFDITVEFKNEEIKTYSYTGAYQNESLEKILELLSLSQKFTYTIKGQLVTIDK
jgi:transmembrane sensor